jgi:HEPN domain-containing protein
MSEHPKGIELIRQWVEKAEEDLLTAEHTLTLGEKCPFAIVCFHAQQCVEKYIKALLVSLTIDFPKIHDIGELTQLLPQGQSISLDESQQERLTDYAVVNRYPGNWEPLTRTDAEEAITLARQVRENIRALLPAEAISEPVARS